MALWLRQLIAIASIVAATASVIAVPDGFSNETLQLVKSNMLAVANASWEKGTAAEALTELMVPTLSVFDEHAVPPLALLSSSTRTNATDVFEIVKDVLAAKPADSKPLFNGQGSVADPASLGTAVLLSNWTRVNKSDTSFAEAAEGQLDYLLNEAPRAPSGAISHRADQVQLWSDFIYMVPPFLAYYGALQGNKTLLQTAYDQISLYRNALADEGGLWRHVALGNWTDDTHWATGNAWAASGMLRVMQTMNHSTQAENFAKHQTNLTKWINEITTAAWQFQSSNGTLHNVIDNSTTFSDSSSTALLASVTYRMAGITGNSSLIESANKALNATKDGVDEQGWLTQTVDPYAFIIPSEDGKHSPEGQAFVLILEAARRNYSSVVAEKNRKVSLARVE